MERGDVVTYDVTGQAGMRQWLHLNGRVGVIVKGPYASRNEHSGERWGVSWILHESPEGPNFDEDYDTHNYPTDFLRKIGHIDLPPGD